MFATARPARPTRPPERPQAARRPPACWASRCPPRWPRRLLVVPRRVTLDDWLTACRADRKTATAAGAWPTELQRLPGAGRGARRKRAGASRTSRPPRRVRGAYWKTIATCPKACSSTKNNADCVRDAATQAAPADHHHRDLGRRGRLSDGLSPRVLIARARDDGQGAGRRPAVPAGRPTSTSLDGRLAEEPGGRGDERDIVVVIPGPRPQPRP